MLLRNSIVVAIAVGALVFSGTSSADDFTWGRTNTLPASGNWSDPTNWVGGISPPANGTVDGLFFGGPTTANYTATNDIAGTITTGSLNFTSNYRGSVFARSASGNGLAFAGAGQINLSGLGSHFLSNQSGGLGLAFNTNVAANISSLGELTISAPITGTGSLTVSGTEFGSHVGFVELQGNNVSWSGDLILQSGNLILNNSSTTIPTTTGNLVVNGGYLGFAGSFTRVTHGTIINTDLRISRGSAFFNGPITINDSNAKLEIFGGSVTFNNTAAFNGATVLGGRVDYAASTGPATLTLGSLSGGTDGTLLNTPSITLNDGASLVIQNTTTNIANRVSDTATIFMDGATISSQANAAGSNEVLGAVTFSGFSTIDSRPGTTAAGNLQLASLTRVDNGVLQVRGQNLGLSAPANKSTITVASGSPTLVGGGGAAGTTTVSIVPWAVGYNANSSTTSPANSLVTYDANGFRPLDLTTEYASALGTNPLENVRIAVAANNDVATQVNGLVVAANITGTGSIDVASGAVLGSGVSAVIVDNSLSFGANEAIVTSANVMTINGNMTGTGGFTKSGNWDLNLNGNNSGLTGTLTINGGTNNPRIDITSAAALPGTGTIHVRGIASTSAAGVGIDGVGIVVNRDFVVHSGQAAFNTLNSSSSGEFSGNISGTGSVNINSSGSWGAITLSGNNTYTGITRLDTGYLLISSDANLGNGGMLVMDTNTGAQGLELLGNWTTSRAVHFNSPTGINTTTFDAVLNGVITGASDMTKLGTGSLTINGDSPYRGIINVNQGTLAVNAMIAANVSSQAGTTVAGVGSFGDLIVRGTLAPGNSVGELDVASMTLYGGSNYAFELGAISDHVNILNALTKNTTTGTTFQFDFANLGGLANGQSIELFHFASTDFVATDFTYTGWSGLEGTFSTTSNGLFFNITAVPEPGVAGFGGLLVLAGCRLRRRARVTLLPPG